MFGKTFRLPFRLLGIPVLLDVTFLIVLPIFAWLIGRQIGAYIALSNQAFGLQIQDPELLTGFTPYWIGLTVALLLFVSVLIHELGHAVVARRFGVQTRSIVLWLLGGVAQFDEMPRQRGAEALVAIIGPIVSGALGVVCLVIAWAMPDRFDAAQIILGSLAWINFVLAIFNLLPALPMDGGRVLRSLLALKMSEVRATQVAGGISKTLAIFLGLLGLLSFNFWFILIAFFIYTAVNSETQQGLISRLLRNVPVRDLMVREVATVPPDITVADLMQRMFRQRHLGFPVAVESQLMGMVTLKDVGNAPPDTPVGAVMQREVPTIREDANAYDAFKVMSQNGFGRLVVTGNDGRMIGLITKADLMRAIQIEMVGVGQNGGDVDHAPHWAVPHGTRPAPEV